MNLEIRDLDARDRGYVISSWREVHKQAPETVRLPWQYYNFRYGKLIKQVFDAPNTSLIGAYDGPTFVGWLAVTYGKRVDTLHWVHTRHDVDGVGYRRRGIMTKLLEAAEIGSPFVYTLHGPKTRHKRDDGKRSSLDELLAKHLRERNIIASYIPLEEWLK